jgi:hypothetical protein
VKDTNNQFRHSPLSAGHFHKNNSIISILKKQYPTLNNMRQFWLQKIMAQHIKL